MKTIKLVGFILVLGLISQVSAFAELESVGYIEYSDGSFSLTRAGVDLAGVDIGEDIHNFDLIKTGPNGLVIIKLYNVSGLSGTLTIKPKTVFTIKTESVRNVPQTQGDLIAGSLAVKVQRLGGSPSFQIRSAATVMGIRGTQFDVFVSVNDALLVSCVEGRVNCSDDEGTELEAFPGQVVERRPGERLRRIPVAVSNLTTFQDQWLTDEITAFAADPLRALSQYAAMYRRYRDSFRIAYDEMARLEALAIWNYEYRQGILPRSTDISVMRQKSSVAPKLLAVRSVLFIFERVYYRLDEINSLIDEAYLWQRLDAFGTVFDFFKVLAAERAELEQKMAKYRYAALLYAQRNEGRDISAMSGGSGDDFFDDLDDFFD